MVKSRFLGGSAVAVLIGSGLAMSPTASVAMVAEAPTKAVCVDEHGHVVDEHGQARVPRGEALGLDPNTLTAAEIEAMEGQAARLVGDRDRLAARANGSVTVPVHVHVLVRNNGSGNVANWRINRQIAVLNEAFSGGSSVAAANTPFRFKLVSIARTRNTDWYDMDSQDSVQARRALRIGDATHLNFYVNNFAGDLEGLLGFATFPGSYQSSPKLDGAVMLNESLPGGDAVYEGSDGTTFNYALGDTAVHEVGHWMNLYHTFQGSCGKNNDFVADTPPQLADENVFYCNVRYNTCGGAGSPKDPVKNFMNYVDDVCMDRFSWGQRDRMNISWYIRQALSD